jgi:hypothetical protein
MDNPYKSNNAHSVGSNRDAWGNTFNTLGITNNKMKSYTIGGVSSKSNTSYEHLMGKPQPSYQGSQSLSPSKDDEPVTQPYNYSGVGF